MKPTLRPYQVDGKRDIYHAWHSGCRNALYVLPTGGGKSVVIEDIVSEVNQRGTASAVIAHRQELVGQMSMHVARGGTKHRIIAPKNVIANITSEHRREFGRSFVDPTARAVVAGVDTIISRRDELAGWAKQIGMWVMDEAHHVLRANKWGTAIEMFSNAYGLGVTASPERADGNGLGIDAEGVFGSMIVGPSMRDLIDMGSLCEYEIVLPESDFDVSTLRIPDSGDWTSKQLRDASKNSHIVGDVVEQYILNAHGKRGVTFATDVETATEIAQRFNDMSIPTTVVSAKTPNLIRQEYIHRFRDGRLMQLVNVDLFGEGFDLPAIEVVSMARPTASLAVYLQQFGRALRPMTGKLRGLIIDHVSNVKRHGFPDKPRYWSLMGRDRRIVKKRDPDDIPVRQCTNCHRGYPAVKRSCPYCGFVPVAAGGGRSIEQVDGDLLLLDAETLKRMREATVLPNPEDMAERALFAGHGSGAAIGQSNIAHARIAEQKLLSDAIALWAGYQRAKGRDDSESYRRFYFATNGIDVATALTLPRTEMTKLRADIESWIK